MKEANKTELIENIKNKRSIGSIFNLIHSYYMTGFFGPFFVVVFPIIMLFIMGQANKNIVLGNKDNTDPLESMRMIVAGIMITTLISTGIMGLPLTIVDFKTSTLIKRIGAADIKKSTFLIVILIYQSMWAFFSVFWVLLWAGINIGTMKEFDWSVAFSKNLWPSFVFIIPVFILSVSIGVFIASISKTAMAAMGITNVLYMPISFLSGSFIPIQQIQGSNVLNSISYALPTKYFTEPFFKVFSQGWGSLSDMGWEAWGFPIIGTVFIVVLLGLSIKLFKWGE